MKQELTPKEIKQLKYETRPGIIFCISIIAITYFITYAIEYEQPINLTIVRNISLLIGILIFYLISKNYFKDIRNGYKILSEKTITGKELKEDNEAISGAGRLFSDKKRILERPIPTHHKFYLIIERHRYIVEEEIYQDAVPGDTVIFHTAPHSGFLLKIELKRDK